MKTQEQNDMINRCLEIEKEYDNIETIHLTIEDVEDISDSYQAKLEEQWYKRDLEDEYRKLNLQLGYPLRRLYPKSERRRK